MLESRAYVLDNTVIRSNGDRNVFRGHAAIFNSLSDDLGGFKETVLPGAFNRSLRESPDVSFLINHEPSKILARTTSGTLVLTEDTRGLAVKADLPNTTYARDLSESMERGDISQMSFRFRVEKDSWEQRDGSNIRSLHDVNLVEVSAVTFPAYQAATGSLEERQLATAIQAMEELRSGKTLSAKNREFLLGIRAQLDEFLSSLDPVERSNPRRLRLELDELF